MAIRNTGKMKPEHINEMNVPVCCHLIAPDAVGDSWLWTARNFMPRREFCGDDWAVEADSKEEIVAWVNENVVPLYEAALHNLRTHGENYYWEHKKTTDGN
jgi:hypothetical protein